MNSIGSAAFRIHPLLVESIAQQRSGQQTAHAQETHGQAEQKRKPDEAAADRRYP